MSVLLRKHLFLVLLDGDILAQVFIEMTELIHSLRLRFESLYRLLQLFAYHIQSSQIQYYSFILPELLHDMNKMTEIKMRTHFKDGDLLRHGSKVRLSNDFDIKFIVENIRRLSRRSQGSLHFALS